MAFTKTQVFVAIELIAAECSQEAGPTGTKLDSEGRFISDNDTLNTQYALIQRIKDELRKIK